MRHRTIRFSQVELVDLVKAWLATSLAFGIFFLGGLSAGFASFVGVVLIAALTAGLGFLGHELAHKLVANHYGVQAEFRSNDLMLVLSILIAFLGFVIAAPGAVWILGNVTQREHGHISAAGPLANIVLALCFLPLALGTSGILSAIGQYGLLINAFLAVFNLIPLFDFDGAKVLRWSAAWYAAMVVAGGLLLVFAIKSGGA